VDARRSVDRTDDRRLDVDQVPEETLPLAMDDLPVTGRPPLVVRPERRGHPGDELVSRTRDDHDLVVRIAADVVERAHPVGVVRGRVVDGAAVAVQADDEDPVVVALERDRRVAVEVGGPRTHLTSW